MHRLVHADLAAEIADGSMPMSRSHRRFVAQNIAEHIGRHHDIELPRMRINCMAQLRPDMLQRDTGVAFFFLCIRVTTLRHNSVTRARLPCRPKSLSCAA